MILCIKTHAVLCRKLCFLFATDRAKFESIVCKLKSAKLAIKVTTIRLETFDFNKLIV